MLLDSTLALVPYGNPLSIVAGAGVAVNSTVLDLLGVGQGVAPPNIIGNTALFGADMGIGELKTLLEIATGTAFTTGNAATLTVALQAAPDTGLAGGYLPGTWQTLIQSNAYSAAQLTAQTVIARFDFPPVVPANLKPRFLRLSFITPTGTNFTAGTIAFAIPTLARDDQANRFQINNFSVA